MIWLNTHLGRYVQFSIENLNYYLSKPKVNPSVVKVCHTIERGYNLNQAMNEISFVQQPDPIDGDHKSVEWWGSVPAKKEGQKVHCLTASWQMHGKEKIMLLQ